MSKLSLTKKFNANISVVIPTLGGESLITTIEKLNNGTIVPTEILICIPEEYAFRVTHLSHQNVRIVKTHCRGQVAQRAIGFQQAQRTMVLQLDDDVLLQKDTLNHLADILQQQGPGNAVGPVYYDAITGNCIHNKLNDGFLGWLKSLYAYLVCGAPWGVKRMGVVTAIGVNYLVDPSHYCSSNPIEAQWLPGGCVLCYKKDLINENFFPFTGKAYCEDLIHSYLRTKNGMSHWVIPYAHCLTNMAEYEISLSSIQDSATMRRYLARLKGGQEWRVTLYNMFSKFRLNLSKWQKYISSFIPKASGFIKGSL